MLEALLKRGERNGRDICAQQGRLRDVVGGAHGGSDDLDLIVNVLARPVIVLDAGDNVSQLLDAILGEGHDVQAWLRHVRHGARVPRDGFSYLVDYGEIEYADRNLGLEHWIEDVVPTAIRTASAGRSSPSRSEQRSFEMRSGSIGTTRSGK